MNIETSLVRISPILAELKETLVSIEARLWRIHFMVCSIPMTMYLIRVNLKIEVLLKEMKTSKTGPEPNKLKNRKIGPQSSSKSMGLKTLIRRAENQTPSPSWQGVLKRRASQDNHLCMKGILFKTSIKNNHSKQTIKSQFMTSLISMRNRRIR